MAHANSDLVERFYAAFAARDGEEMAACYSDDVSFADPVFTALRGSEAGGDAVVSIEAGVDQAPGESRRR